MEEIHTKIYESPPMTDAAVVAHVWLARGWQIAPCQPGTKVLLRGYGPTLGGIKSAEQVEYWFRYRRCNLAVFAPDHGLVLDFDRAELYERFRSKPGAELLYTERTPRGGAHVFCLTDQKSELSRFRPVDGLELKNTALVYPSAVGGDPYQVIGGKIAEVDARMVLEGFGAYLPTSPAKTAVVPSCGQIGHAGRGLVDQAKAAWPILNYMTFFSPQVKLTGSGRWRHARCPWHDDKKPSLWIDTERDTWGCHACGAHGDVLNWEQMRTGYTMAEVIRELLDYASKVVVKA